VSNDSNESEKFPDAPVICASCAFFLSGLTHRKVPLENQKGVCIRYPTEVDKFATAICGEHKFAAADAEILATDLEMLPMINPRTRKILRGIGLHTIGDILTVGRGSIFVGGKPDRRAIEEISRAMTKLGVDW